MLNRLIDIFERVRRRFCPQRIYKYGKVGLAVHDDRSIAEKVFDYLHILLYGLKVKHEHKQRGDIGFRPYFDWSLGLWINNRSAIRDIERQTGLEYVTVKEWEKESGKQRRYMDEKFENKLEKRLGDVIKDINQGRSFLKENREKRRKIYQQYGRNG
jgi:hypothetical protein